MMNNNENNENLGEWRTYIRDIRSNNENLGEWRTYIRDIGSFSIIVFMISLMIATVINTQAGMKLIADVLAFFGLGCLVIGIAAQLIRMRK